MLARGSIRGHRRASSFSTIKARLLTDYIIIFGAAVRADGTPSPALQHRIDCALDWARRHPSAMLMPTGAVGAHGAAEATVIARSLVAAGIAPTRIVPETHARDTLESVRLCDALLRARSDCGRVICCTSAYHQPRCGALLRLLGYRVVMPPISQAMGRLRRRDYALLVAKEIVATPYDLGLLLVRGRIRQGPPPA